MIVYMQLRNWETHQLVFAAGTKVEYVQEWIQNRIRSGAFQLLGVCSIRVRFLTD